VEPQRTSRVVIVGAGHAGSNAAAFLRQFGWPGEVLLLGEEPALPYHRPPLSKAWLKGEATAESLALRPAAFYEAQRIGLRTGTRVEGLDHAARRLRLAGGEALTYDHLILATGARARRIPLPGADLPGVLALRNAADADRLKAALGPGRHIAVVGAGWIGLEVAASARALGARATVLEAAPRALARVASPALSAFVEAAHRAQGVALLTGAGVEAIEPDAAGRAAAVRLADGTRIACDAVLMGVGAVAEDGLAREAGLADPTGGVFVDARARTAEDGIHAIGDLTIRPLPGGTGRLESVPSAVEQARQAAADLCVRPPPAPEVPWFWSDQYHLRIQVAGLCQGMARSVPRGDPAAGDRLAVFHLDAAGAVRAVEAVNAAPEFMAGKRLIAGGRPVAPDHLADPSRPLQALAA
jgi:3-phenylpropionate/trans-cinnamate dioxygenase ferredoxin reductase component